MIAIKLLGWANRRHTPMACAGDYIMTVDVQQADLSLDWLSTTPDIEQAKTWPDTAAAFKTYREILKSQPIRDDGEANRPLTAILIDFVNVEEAKETAECNFGNDN